MTARNDAQIETTQLWSDFQNARAYQTNIGLTQKIPLYVRFYEGDQWPKPTKLTKSLPRPVINITKMICRSKKSSILSTPVKLVYQADDDTVNVEKFNRFAEYIQKEINQDALDKKGISDAVKKGSYFFHYYWDSEAKGKKGTAPGGLRCEMIDVLNIFFADPTETDEQKQAWIMIVSRETVSSVRAKCDADVDKETIVADEPDDPYGAKEQDGSALVTVLTRYFRRDGEVYIEKATKSVIVNKPFPLTPDLEAARRALSADEDAPNNSLPDNAQEGKTKDKLLISGSARAYLYPIVVGNYEEREKCIYGLGEIEGIIQNQRSINFNVAMMLLASQELGWGKYLVRKDALGGQSITNEPGQVIVDYSKEGNGIKRLGDPSMPSQPMQIVEALMQMTRVVTGASELMTGETVGANMSGAAIAQLQSQALQPVEELKNTFWNVKEKQGRVLAQFFKLFYTDKKFSFSETREVLDPVAQENRQEDVRDVGVFHSSEFANADFEVVVEATGGTNASVAGDINALDIALQNGAISPKTYFELYPRDALSNRTEILERLSSDEANKVAVMEAQLQQMQEALAARDAMIAEQKETVEQVDRIIVENQRLRVQLAKLYGEASEKIRDANLRLAQGNARIRETETDAAQMAEYISAQGEAAPQNSL